MACTGRRSENKKVFIEFEGVRQAADFYVNGKHIGLHENGVMALFLLNLLGLMTDFVYLYRVSSCPVAWIGEKRFWKH